MARVTFIPKAGKKKRYKPKVFYTEQSSVIHTQDNGETNASTSTLKPTCLKGAMMVKVGRRREKRYGEVFTCLEYRAAHEEIASSLTTYSCIMALRRFCPKEIYSDNGKNFKRT